MNILILGASGQIGKEIYKEFTSNGSNHVRGTSRSEKKDCIQFDPFKDDWKDLGKVDVLVNCVGQIEESREFSFDKVHRELTLLILKNRTLLGNPKIVQLSVLGASTDSPIDFLKTKGIADEYLTQHPDTVVVRASIVCTPDTMMVRKMKMVRELSRFTFGWALVPDKFPEHKIQPVMVKDLAIIVSRVCVSENVDKFIYVVGPQAISYKRILELAFEAKGKRLKLVRVPRWLTDIAVKNLIAPFFPSVINDQQYHLLFEDNVFDKSESEKYLGTPLSSTIDFWKTEFK